MAKTPTRLGKGLSALIPARDTAASVSSPAAQLSALEPNQIRHLPVGSISPNRHQPRTTFNDASLTALAESIRIKGVLQPIVVRRAHDHSFELVAGERRWRAAQLAGLQTIPAMVREFSDAESFEIALIENLQREDLAPLERAGAYQHYLDAFGGSIENLAQRLAESRANVSNYLRLLKLCPDICYLLGTGELGMGHARAIAGIDDPQRQIATARMAIRRNLSVRQVEEFIRAADQKLAEPVQKPADPATEAARRHLTTVEQTLTKVLGLRVRLRGGRRKNSGRVIISYANLEEFDRLAERLGAGAHLE